MRAGEAAVGDSQGSFGFVESGEQIVVATFGIEPG